MKILIDNGHGIDTPGKRSPDGRLREYRYTREIAAAVVSGLKQRGLEAIRLVPEEVDIPLKERVRRANAYGQDNILISIHCNAAGKGKEWLQPQGWAAYTTIGETNADLLASKLYEAAEANFPERRIRKDFSDGDADFEASFYVIRHTIMPAVLTENFMMDNLDDVAFLLSDEGRAAVIRTHIDGIIGYLSAIKYPLRNDFAA